MKESLFNINEIAGQLKPLYQELIDDTKNFEHQDLISFCMQWGNKYSPLLMPSLMFIGRANNGWMCFDRDVEEIFNQQNEERAFNRDDQMIWVEDCANNLGHYNTNNSAFWRVVRGVSRFFFPEDDLSHICWSNLCKVAPDGKNPTNKLFYAQLKSCQRILEKEIDIFQPKHIILLTGYGWAKDFLEFLNQGQSLSPEEIISWDKYCVNVYKINQSYFYLSEHPQGKKEGIHIKELIKAITQRNK